MRLPEQLKSAIDELVAGTDQASLKRASAELTSAYKSGDFGRPPLVSTAHKLAYSLVRMPATYAANVHVFQHLKASIPDLAPLSVFDVGAGPGTSSWAVAETFSSVEKYTLMERDPELLQIGKSLASQSVATPLSRAEWVGSDIEKAAVLPNADLVVVSYAIGELGQKARLALIQHAWAAAQQVLVIIEPGTRRGFDIILNARRELVNINAKIVAPCPHMQQCPMAAVNDWCHFAQRIERSSEHRRIKEGSLGHEDEKFSYIAAAKLPVSVPRARIVRHPQIFSGYVKLQLCSGPVLEAQTVTRSQKSAYKAARHASWGDDWNH